MKVAIYARVSTTDQNYEGQLEELHALAERSGWEVVEVYSEKISGTKATEERPELKRMMHDAKLPLCRCQLCCASAKCKPIDALLDAVECSSHSLQATIE